MLVSIVLPTHNGSRYLAESVRSCVGQTFTDWELIIVDDCSDDGTPQVIAELEAADSRIRSIRNDPNRRLPASLNIGFAAARGDLLTWTSDDNRYRPDALARMVDHLLQHPDVGLVYADWDIIDGEGVNRGQGWLGDVGEMGYRNVVGACFLYRRCVLEQVGNYAEDLYLAEDYDYWLRILSKYPIARIRRCLYDYRVHSSSLTTTQSEGVRAATAATLRRHIEALAKTAPHVAAQGHMHLARDARDGGDEHTMRAHAISAFRLAPLVPLNCHRGVLADLMLGCRAAARLRKAVGCARSGRSG